MARFNSVGIDELQLSFAELARLPDNVIDAMLDAGGAVLVAAHKKSLRSLGLVNTGKLAESISAHKKRSGGKRYLLVYPYGQHHTYNQRLVTKKYARSKSGRTYTVGGGKGVASNDEVGFVLEFGAPGRNISSRNWMKRANESAADEVAAAEMKPYEKWLNSINL